MYTNQRKYILPATLTILFFLLLSLITNIGEASPLLLNFTPTAYVYLPYVINQPTPTPTPTPTVTLIPPDDIANELTIANLLNQYRNSQGLPSLTLVSELTQAARRHSRDMADNNFTSHIGSDGSNAGQRMQEAGYSWTSWGEIIGWGFSGDPAMVVDAWLNSPPHKSIILSSTFTDFGVGYARNSNSDWEHYWTVNFGKRAAQGAALPQRLLACMFTYQGQWESSSLMIYSSDFCQ